MDALNLGGRIAPAGWSAAWAFCYLDYEDSGAAGSRMTREKQIFPSGMTKDQISRMTGIMSGRRLVLFWI
jgi:hypothetical protein